MNDALFTDADLISAVMQGAAQMQREFAASNISAVLAPRQWAVFLDEIRAGTLRAGPDSPPLVEGVDYTLDLQRGVVTLLSHAFAGFPVEVSAELQLRVEANVPAKVFGQRRMAQWKAEKRGRRA